MSADNGIYILPIKRPKTHSVTGEDVSVYVGHDIVWRVIHAGGIDNITYEPDREDGYNGEELARYFEDALEFDNEQEAILYAHEQAKDYAVLEYGVSHLPQTDYKFKKKHKDCIGKQLNEN